MMLRTILCILFLTASSAVWGEESNSFDTGPVITLSADEQQRLGISDSELVSKEITLSYPAVVRAVDPIPLAELVADFESALVAAQASERQLERANHLASQDKSVSQQALESARAQAIADAAKAKALQQRLSLKWGPAFVAMTSEDRSKLLSDISSGQSVLVRADVPDRPDGVIGVVLIEEMESQDIIRADTIGPSGSLDPRMQTVGLYGVINGEPAVHFRPGKVVNGEIQTDIQVKGVLIPRPAIIRLDGKAWVYAQTGPDRFERKVLHNPQILPDGWLVSEGLKPGERIVTREAGAVRAAEDVNSESKAD